MRKVIVTIIVVSVFISSLAGSAYAGQIQAKEITHDESLILESMQASSDIEVKPVICGSDSGDVALGILVGLFFIGLLAAAASSGA